MPFSILTVCTANICRSPAAAVLLERGLSGVSVGLGLSTTWVIGSAGVRTVADLPPCDAASRLVGRTSSHTSRPVTVEIVAAADLVLALDRSHRAALASLSPRARSRTFTLRQAAQSATYVADLVQRGELPEGAPAFPAVPAERLSWWVAELDAARGVSAPQPSDGDHPIAHPLDVPDPHVVGDAFHGTAVNLIASAVEDVVASLREVLGAEPRQGAR